jgi:pathogenesis-related protein 1
MTLRLPRIALLALLTAGLVGFVAGRVAADVTPAQQAALLAAHNTLRRDVAAAETRRLGRTVAIPDLTWNPDAAAVAQAWASSLLATDTFDYNPDAGNVGENIYLESGADPATSGDRAFASWAAEAASYSWDTDACADACGDFTQLVWASTTSVGCGMATDGTTTYWVCDYAPPGNLTGQRPYEPGGPAAASSRTGTAPASPMPTSAPAPPVAPAPSPPPSVPLVAPPVTVTVRNEGGYVARFSLTYTLNGMPTTVTADAVLTGTQQTRAIPAGASTIVLTVEEFTGFNWTIVFTQRFGTPVTVCYTVAGTTLSATWTPVSCASL